MRVLVFGASGMLGRDVVRVLSPDCDVVGVSRRDGLMLTHESASGFIATAKPDVVINAVGIVKQRQATAPEMIVANSLWPHMLSSACDGYAQLVHISTDCVFSGSRGMYSEDDVPDAPDLYGRSKLLGEVTERDVTIRTSIVAMHGGLLGWFAEHRHERLTGYSRAVFSGLTTDALAGVIRDVVIPSGIRGLWHVSAEPIDKHTLLSMVSERMGWDVELDECDTPRVDRSLDSTRFREYTGWSPPTWESMVRML